MSNYQLFAKFIATTTQPHIHLKLVQQNGIKRSLEPQLRSIDGTDRGISTERWQGCDYHAEARDKDWRIEQERW
jgi:hypothetical protein